MDPLLIIDYFSFNFKMKNKNKYFFSFQLSEGLNKGELNRLANKTTPENLQSIAINYAGFNVGDTEPTTQTEMTDDQEMDSRAAAVIEYHRAMDPTDMFQHNLPSLLSLDESSFSCPEKETELLTLMQAALRTCMFRYHRSDSM